MPANNKVTEVKNMSKKKNKVEKIVDTSIPELDVSEAVKEKPVEDVATETVEPTGEETVKTPEEPQMPEGEGEFWIVCEAVDRNFRCEGPQVENKVKILVGRVPVNATIVITRVK
jgi:hypothetical protein